MPNFAADIEGDICVFSAAMHVTDASLDKIRLSNGCRIPIPKATEIRGAEQSKLWWYYDDLTDHKLLLQDSVLGLSDFLFKEGVYHVRYVDGFVRTKKFFPDNMGAFKTPLEQFSFPLEGRGVAVKDIYLGLDIQYPPSRVRLNISKKPSQGSFDFNLYWAAIGLIIGIQFAMVLYNLTLALQFRFNFHISYCCLALSALVYNFLLLGGDILLLHDANSNTLLKVRYLSLGHLVFFSILFIVSFVERFAISNWNKHLLLGASGFALLVAALSFFTPLGYTEYSMGAFDVAVVIVTATILYTIYISLRRKSRAIWFILLAWTPMIFATIYRLLYTYGLVEYSMLVDISIPIASSLEMVILSVGVSDRLRSIKIERDRVTQSNKQLVIDAHTDSLTGAGNRRYLSARLSDIETSTTYQNAELALILFDIDQFKAVNDSWGHDAGDAVLVEIARRVKEISRAHEIFARIGGEEFALLVPGATPEVALNIAERIRTTILNIDLFRIAPIDKPITVSLGVVVDKVNGVQYSTLFQHADKALYRAKRSGRNNTVMYDETLESETTSDQDLGRLPVDS